MLSARDIPFWKKRSADLIVEGELVVGHAILQGTNTSEFGSLVPMMPPTRKPVTISGIMIARINAKGIGEDWYQTDTLSRLQQLGAIPPMGERLGKSNACHSSITRITHMTQHVVEPQEEAMKDILEVRERSVTTRSTQLYVRMVGNPEADTILIMIHGGPGLSHRYLLGLEQLAGPQLMVVSYDQRGSGRSSVSAAHENTEQARASGEPRSLAEAGDFDLLTYSQGLEAVRGAVAGQKRVDLLGHSWGGLVAMHYTTLYPQQVRSLLLIGSIPPSWSGFEAGLMRFQERVQALQRQGIIPLVLPADPWEQRKCMFPAYLADPTQSLSAEQFEYDHRVEQQTMAVVQGFDLTDQLAKLPHRVLILWGEDDSFGRAWGEETKAALSNASVEFVVISHSGHFGWMECPDAFSRSIRTFLGLFS